MDRSRTRSAAYQHILLEIAFSNDMMEPFSNESSIADRLCPFIYDEEVLDLEDQLKAAFWRIVKKLTPRQQEIIRLSNEGLTQMEIAKKLKVNQSSITKSIHGNVDYKGGKRSYGGAIKKIQSFVENDIEIKQILESLAAKRESKW